MKERQEALYNYLLSRNGEWTTHAEIARELYQYYGNAECCLEPKDFHNTTERTLITEDCREISVSTECEKIIISSSKGVKIANEAEFDRYIKSQYNATICKLARIYKMAKKCNRNGQIDFGGHTVESFLENLPENY
jgi:hypothetical protein